MIEDSQWKIPNIYHHLSSNQLHKDKILKGKNSPLARNLALITDQTRISFGQYFIRASNTISWNGQCCDAFFHGVDDFDLSTRSSISCARQRLGNPCPRRDFHAVVKRNPGGMLPSSFHFPRPVAMIVWRHLFSRRKMIRRKRNRVWQGVFVDTV